MYVRKYNNTMQLIYMYIYIYIYIYIYENPQVELHFLRSCLSLCKINHLLRNVPPDKATSQLWRFDVNLRKSLEGIASCSLSENSWK